MKRLSKWARRPLALALGLAVIASVAGLAAYRQLGSQAHAAAAPASSAAPGSVQSRADLSKMQALLNSGSVSEQAVLLVPGFRFAPGSKPVFPAGTTVTIRPGTLRSDGGQFATVKASLSDGTAVTLGLYAVQGRWRLYSVGRGSAQARAKIIGQPASARLTGATVNHVPTSQEIGHRQPVILIHGIFNGAAGTFGSDADPASMFFAIDMMHGTWTSAYDYSPYDGEWVDVTGPPFAQYIRAVAKASREAGGPGKVVIVAYSMGGLITRWAATDGGEAKDIAMVITIATPNTGAPLSDAANVAHAIVCKAPQSVQHHVPYMSEFCAEFTAAAGMAQRGPEIKNLKELPPSIPLHSIAGELTILSALGNSMVTVPLGGDAIVPVSSALHQRPGGNQDIIPPFRSHTGLPDYSYWHGALPQNRDVIRKVHDLVYDYLQSHPVTTLGGADYWLANGGKWYVHDMSLQISRGPTGLVGMETWNAYGTIVNGYVDLAFTPQPDGSLLGTFTENPTYVPTGQGDPSGFRADPDAPKKGEVIRLVPIAPMHAKTVFVSNPGPLYGNTNLCQLGLPGYSNYCGA